MIVHVLMMIIVVVDHSIMVLMIDLCFNDCSDDYNFDDLTTGHCVIDL